MIYSHWGKGDIIDLRLPTNWGVRHKCIRTFPIKVHRRRGQNFSRGHKPWSAHCELKLWNFRRLKVPNSRLAFSPSLIHGLYTIFAFNSTVYASYAPFSGPSWHLSRQPCQHLSSRFALHGLCALELPSINIFSLSCRAWHTNNRPRGTHWVRSPELSEPKKTHWVRCLKPYSPKPYSARFRYWVYRLPICVFSVLLVSLVDWKEHHPRHQAYVPLAFTGLLPRS